MVSQKDINDAVRKDYWDNTNRMRHISERFAAGLTDLDVLAMIAQRDATSNRWIAKNHAEQFFDVMMRMGRDSLRLASGYMKRNPLTEFLSDMLLSAPPDALFKEYPDNPNRTVAHYAMSVGHPTKPAEKRLSKDPRFWSIKDDTGNSCADLSKFFNKEAVKPEQERSVEQLLVDYKNTSSSEKRWGVRTVIKDRLADFNSLTYDDIGHLLQSPFAELVLDKTLERIGEDFHFLAGLSRYITTDPTMAAILGKSSALPLIRYAIKNKAMEELVKYAQDDTKALEAMQLAGSWGIELDPEEKKRLVRVLELDKGDEDTELLDALEKISR